VYDRRDMDHLTLGAAIDRAGVLFDAAGEAEATRAPSVLPLPYLWIPKATLDGLAGEREADAAVAVRSTRRRRGVMSHG